MMLRPDNPWFLAPTPRRRSSHSLSRLYRMRLRQAEYRPRLQGISMTNVTLITQTIKQVSRSDPLRGVVLLLVTDALPIGHRRFTVGLAPTNFVTVVDRMMKTRSILFACAHSGKPTGWIGLANTVLSGHLALDMPSSHRVICAVSTTSCLATFTSTSSKPFPFMANP